LADGAGVFLQTLEALEEFAEMGFWVEEEA
jgi:hypothetical protein